MLIQEIISESSQPDLVQILKDFLPLAMRELGLKKLPKIKLEKIVYDPQQPTFGRFVNKTRVIHLGVANRHPLDILRTLAHELVHYKQYIEGNLPKGAGETGSPQENEAHIMAGVIMRHFNKAHPNYFRDKPLEFDLSESYQLDEGLGDWIYKKIDDLIGEPGISPQRVSRLMKQAPANLPDDIAEKLVSDFMKRAEAQRLAQQAAEAQKTTVEKIVPYLTYFAREFKRRWEQIPQRDRQNALRNLAHNILNLLLFILKAMASSKK